MFNVLVVDDDLITREVIKSILENNNCKVDEARNGEEALDKFKYHQYDFILLDYRLPDINGIELAQNIRFLENEKDPNKRIPIICISSKVNKDNEQYFFDAGIDSCISKPVDEKTLQEVIKAFVE